MTKPAYWLNEDSRTFLSRGYLLPGQTAEERIRDISVRAEQILGRPGFADEFEGYMLNGWISLSSPIWANFGNDRGLPISCNNSYIGDTSEDILFKVSEIGMMTKYGAGTSAYLGHLRPRGAAISGGGVSNGPVHFAELIEATTNVISQSSVRRGSAAVYLDVDHPDIMEFLELREEGNTIQHLSMGVNISDEWLASMVAGDSDKRKIWGRIIRKRFETGYPYIVFSDNVNNNAPQAYKDKGRKINGSNLCSEIALSSTEDESFVCNLSSLNLLHYDDWKDSGVVEALTMFLDAVMSEYIEKIAALPPRAFALMESAYNFAVRQRAIGVGSLGWHSYLQSKSIAFESFQAKKLNIEIHKLMDQRTLAASQELARTLGEPEFLKGYGVRNVTRMAIAPTTSSSFILGQVSPSIEPQNSNYYVKDLAKGKFTYRNPYLQQVLADLGQDTEEVWRGILIRGGSVQHLDFLPQHDKDVFKTFGEIDQGEIVAQAAQRQRFIDQSQSLNIMVHPDTPVKVISELLLAAHAAGVKSMYYQRSTNPAQELARSLITCAACEA